MQRLAESATRQGLTLWGAVHAYLAERPSASRAELIVHFKRDEQAKVRSISNDLVASGLVPYGQRLRSALSGGRPQCGSARR
jgi:hypothetical protein